MTEFHSSTNMSTFLIDWSKNRDESETNLLFQYDYRPRLLAGSNTFMEPMIILKAKQFSEQKRTDVNLYILGYRLLCKFRVASPFSTLNHHSLQIRNHINNFLHEKYQKNTKLLLRDSIYVSSIDIKPDTHTTSQIHVRVSRLKELEKWGILSALSSYMSANNLSTQIELLNGEKSYGRLSYTAKTAVDIFKEEHNIDYRTWLQLNHVPEIITIGSDEVCAVHIDDIHFTNENHPDEAAFFCNPNAGKLDKNYIAEAMSKRDKIQALSTQDEYDRHYAEYRKRVFWCLNQGTEFHPAYSHLHKAPGNDANFMVCERACLKLLMSLTCVVDIVWLCSMGQIWKHLPPWHS